MIELERIRAELSNVIEHLINATDSAGFAQQVEDLDALECHTRDAREQLLIALDCMSAVRRAVNKLRDEERAR